MAWNRALIQPRCEVAQRRKRKFKMVLQVYDWVSIESKG